MKDGEKDAAPRASQLVVAREAIVRRIRTGETDLSDVSRAALDKEFDALSGELCEQFRKAWLDSTRLAVAVELARAFAQRLTLLRNYSVDPTSDLRMMASLLRAAIEQGVAEGKLELHPSELAFLRGVLALHAAEPGVARAAFEEVAASEAIVPDDDWRYDSSVFLAHMAHEEGDFRESIRHAERAVKLATDDNRTAQALSLVALNRYAVGERARALRKFEDALRYFDRRHPLFNQYFYRNTLLFAGIVCFETKDDDGAERYFTQAAEESGTDSYDAFDAKARLARVLDRKGRQEEAAAALEAALKSYPFAESEPLLEVWLLLGRVYAKRGAIEKARSYLLKVVSSDVDHPEKERAREELAGLVVGENGG